MQIVTLSVMKNEADIIEIFIRYHLQWVSRMVIVDHGSTDSSARTVQQLIDKGLPLELYFSNEIGHNQNTILNSCAQQVLKQSRPDWIIPLDIDEFIVAAQPLHLVLAAASKDSPLELLWKTYIPSTHDDPSEKNVLKRIQHRAVREVGHFAKIAIPEGLLSKGLRIGMGNHGLTDSRGLPAIKNGPCQELALAHFPVRSPEQFMGKVLAGWLATAAKAEKAKNEAFHWKRNFDAFISKGMPSYTELQACALELSNLDNNELTQELLWEPLLYEINDEEHLSNLTYEANPIGTALLTAERIALEFSSMRADRLKLNRHQLMHALVLHIKRKLRKMMVG
jgi:hypothetical protein